MKIFESETIEKTKLNPIATQTMNKGNEDVSMIINVDDKEVLHLFQSKFEKNVLEHIDSVTTTEIDCIQKIFLYFLGALRQLIIQGKKNRERIVNLQRQLEESKQAIEEQSKIIEEIKDKNYNYRLNLLEQRISSLEGELMLMRKKKFRWWRNINNANRV